MRQFLQKNQKQIILIFLVSMWVLFSILLLLSLIKPIYIDEGVFLTIGKGISHGKQMYLDFWDHKTPGIHYLWASLFGLFGTKVILYKVFVWLINFFTAGLVYLLSEKLGRGSGKFSVIVFLTSLVFLEGNYLSTGPFLAFFLALSAWFLLSDNKKPYFIFLSGTSLALAFIFKQAALLNLPIFLCYFIFTKRYKDILFFLTGVFVPIALMLLYFSKVNTLSEFWLQVFNSSGNYSPEPYSFRFHKWLETMSRVWWLWLGFVIGVMTFKINQKGKWFVLFMALLPVISFVRHYPHYWLQVSPFLSVIAGIGFVSLIKKYYLPIVIVLVLIPISLTQNVLWFEWTTNNLNKPKQKEETEVIKLINDLPGSKLFAENRYTSFYFLSDKKPLTKFLYQTEVNESQKAQDLILNELKRSNQVVILWPKDQGVVYSKDTGAWIIKNAQEVNEFPELNLILYFKN